MKKLLSLSLALLLLLSVGVSAAVYAPSPKPSLNFDGTTAVCEVSIISHGDEIEATLELRQGARVLAAWSDSGSDSLVISETYPVTRGQTYSLRLYGSINGEPIEDITVSATCR